MGKMNVEKSQLVIDMYVAGLDSAVIAEKMSVHRTTVTDIVSGKSWKSCKRPSNIIDIAHQRRGLQKGWNDDHHSEIPPLTESQSDIITGSLLGDGSIRSSTSNCYFSNTQCVAHAEYIEWMRGQLSPYSRPMVEVYSDKKPSGVSGDIRQVKVERRLVGYMAKTCCHPVFNALRQKWYPSGTKIVPLDLKLTPLSVAVWYCDDGSNSYNHRRITLCTQSFSLHEVFLLRGMLSREFSLLSTEKPIISKYGDKQAAILISGKSYDDFIEIVSPYIPFLCMSRKISIKPRVMKYKRLTKKEVVEIRSKRQDCTTCELASRYGVEEKAISNLLSGKTWRKISDTTQ